jgi:hypothetical protein
LPEGGSLMAALQFKDLPWFIVNVCPPQPPPTSPNHPSGNLPLLTSLETREMKSSQTHLRKSSTTISQPRQQHLILQLLNRILTKHSRLSNPSHRGKSFRARTSCARTTRRFRSQHKRACWRWRTRWRRRHSM